MTKDTFNIAREEVSEQYFYDQLKELEDLISLSGMDLSIEKNSADADAKPLSNKFDKLNSYKTYFWFIKGLPNLDIPLFITIGPKFFISCRYLEMKSDLNKEMAKIFGIFKEKLH